MKNDDMYINNIVIFFNEIQVILVLFFFQLVSMFPLTDLYLKIFSYPKHLKLQNHDYYNTCSLFDNFDTLIFHTFLLPLYCLLLRTNQQKILYAYLTLLIDNSLIFWPILAFWSQELQWLQWHVHAMIFMVNYLKPYPSLC